MPKRSQKLTKIIVGAGLFGSIVSSCQTRKTSERSSAPPDSRQGENRPQKEALATDQKQSEVGNAFHLYQSALLDYMQTDAYQNPPDDLAKEFNTSVAYASKIKEDDIRGLIQGGYFDKFNARIAEEMGESLNWQQSSPVSFALASRAADADEDEEKDEHSPHVKNTAIALVVFGTLGALRVLSGNRDIAILAAPGDFQRVASRLDGIMGSVGFLTVGALILADKDGDEQKKDALKGMLIASGAVAIARVAASGIEVKNALNHLTVDPKVRVRGKVALGVGMLFSALVGAGFIAWGTSLNLTESKTPQEQLVDRVSEAFGTFLALEAKS